MDTKKVESLKTKKIYYTGDIKDKNRKVVRVELDEHIDNIQFFPLEELSEYLKNLNEEYKGWFDRVLIELSLPCYYELEQDVGLYFLGERLETDEEYEQRMIKNG